MNNNCFVQKLKGEIDNISALRLGEFKIHLGADPNGYGRQLRSVALTSTNQEETTVRVLDGTKRLILGGSTYSILSFNSDFGGISLDPNNEFDIAISNKYNIKGLNLEQNQSYFFLDLDDLAYLENLEDLRLSYTYSISGKISSLPASLKRLELKALEIYSESSEYLKFTSLEKITLPKNLILNIGDWGTLVNLEEIQAGYISGISGSCEDIIESMWSNNRRSGTFKIIQKGAVKYHNTINNVYESIFATFTNSNVTVQLIAGDQTTVESTAVYNGTNWTYN